MIYGNLSNPDFQIGTAVRELGYTEDYVRKCFLKELGCTPQEYLTMLRIQGKLLFFQTIQKEVR